MTLPKEIQEFNFTRHRSSVEAHLDEPGQFTKDYVIMRTRMNLEKCMNRLELLLGETVTCEGLTEHEDWEEIKAHLERINAR